MRYGAMFLGYDSDSIFVILKSSLRSESVYNINKY